jgi:hypothetical protein
MAKFVILGAVILSLALFSPCSASMLILGKQAVPKGKSPQTVQTTPSSPSKPLQGAVSSPSKARTVVNIVVDRVEGGVIYSNDGRKFEITGFTKVIDNSHRVTKMRIAELAFENDGLVTVILK